MTLKTLSQVDATNKRELQMYEDYMRERMGKLGYRIVKRNSNQDVQLSGDKRKGFRIVLLDTNDVVTGENYDLSLADVEASLQNLTEDLKRLQAKVKSYKLKVLAGLDKAASSAQIKSDLAQITKTKSKVKIVGEVDKSATKKNVDTAIKNLKSAEVKLTGVLDSSATQKNTTTLIEDSMILAKVSQLDSAAATEYLTSAMKGYKTAAQDVIGIVDKLTAVDLVSATDAGGLAEAMSRTAITANMAGISVDRLLGYLATVGEVTQKSMSSVGESFKTIFTRMSDIKANKLELIDEDGTTETLSDVEQALKNVGIDLRKTVNEYNNYGDVLDNLAAKWDTLSQVQQNALAKAFAGTRQEENFRVLMQNYSAAMKYMDIAADSAGTATEKFSLYVDSIEAKTARFTAAIEGLALDTVDAGFVGDLVDAGTAIIELVEKADLLKAALVSLGAGAVLKGISAISSGFLAAKQNILDLGEAVQTLRNVQNVGALSADTITRLGGLTKGLTDEQLRLVLSTQQLTTAQMTQILTAGGLTKAEAAAKLKMLGLATAEGTATAATFTLSGAMTGLGMAIRAAFASNPVGMIMLAVGAAYELVRDVMAIYDAVTATAEEAKEKADELHSAFEETVNELESVNSELETSRDRLTELFKLSEAGTISIVEQEELDNLKEEVALLEQRERFLKAQKEREAKEANEALENAFNKQSFKADLHTYAVEGLRKEREELERFREDWSEQDRARYDEIKGRISSINEPAYRGGFDIISGKQIGQKMEFADCLQLLVDRYNELGSIGLSKKTQADLYGMEALKDRLGAIGSDLSEDILQYEGDGAFKDLLQGYLDSIDTAINKSAVFEREIGKLPEKCANSLSELGSRGMLTSDMVGALAEDFPELKTAMDTAGLTAEQVAVHFNSLSASQKDVAESSDVYSAQLQNLSDVISDLKSSYDLLETAQKDMSNGGGLSPETIEKLAKAEGNYLDYLYEENGVVKLNTEAWEKNANAKMLGETDKIQKDIDSLNQRNDILRETLKIYEDQRILGDPNGEYAQKIREIISEMEKNSEAVEKNQDLLRLYTAIYQQISGNGTTAFASLTDALSKITEQYDLLTKAQEECANSGVLTASTLSSIVSKYPEMEQSVNLYIAGLKTEQELLDELSIAYGVDLKNYQNAVLRKMETSAEFYNSLGEDQKKLIDELGESYGVDLKNFKTIEQKKLQFQAEIIKQLVANYSKYSNASLDGMKAQYDMMLISGGDAKELKALGDAINAIDRYNYTLKNIAAGVGISSWKPEKFKGISSKSSSGSSTKEIEEYTAAINEYREAEERLRKAQEVRGNIESKIDESDNLKEKILLEKQLIGAYEREQEALRNLNDQRGNTITAGVKSLRELGFAVKYNADTNELWVENMERLNELVADGKGEYDTLQEATNALRKETEDLINSLTDLNEENREGSANWRELNNSMKGSREEINALLDEIVEKASDAVDSIQEVYDTLHDAADEYAESGCITIDTLQSIIGLGVKYVAYLMDENGQLVINEERIRNVIAARTQQMAIESSLSYIEALRMAKVEGDIATLNNLLYATEEATNATWGFVYASLAMAGLDDQQYQAALHNINAIRALADSAVHSIGQTAGSVTKELENMKSGVDDILKYVMEMLKQRIHDQIDALEDMKDAYSDLIDLKKDSLEASKDEADYEKKRAALIQKMAKLQARIDALSLDDSRAAQAERAKLLEELAELQDDLNETQADKALEATKDSLDAQEDAYHKEKDKEIAILEDSISSYQKLYDMAIAYIESHWDTLYSELIGWNTQYGNVLNSEITSAWENCLAAAQRYGSYVSALNSLPADISAAQSAGQNFTVGQTNYDNKFSKDDQIHAIIKEVYQNSQLWHTADSSTKAALDKRNLELGAQLSGLGINAKRDAVWGSWYVGNERLFDKYKQYIYHGGGIAGDVGTVKDDEILAKLQKGETVLTTQMWDNVTKLVERMDHINHMMNAFADTPPAMVQPILPDFSRIGSSTVNNVTTNNSNQPVEIHLGDVIIQGNASTETVKQHQKVTYDMVDEIARILQFRI